MKHTDLTYLKSMSGGSKELIQEMVDIFISQVEEFSEGMDNYLNNKDWDNLGKLAHKAKSSVAIMGMEKLANDLKRLELLTLEEKEIEIYPEIISKFKNECREAVTELNDFLFKLQ